MTPTTIDTQETVEISKMWYNVTIGEVPLFAIFAILLAVIIILVLFLFIINSLVKSGKHLTLNLFKKKSDPNKPTTVRSNKKIDETKRLILSNIQNHKFFSYTKFKYVGLDYNLVFENYEMLIEHGIKNESKELQEFKKLIASRFLSDCIFKYLFDSVKVWVDNVVKEYEDNSSDKTYVPVSLCDIIEDLIHFTKETTRMSSQVRLTFNNHLIEGIPPDFVKYFCKIVNRDMKIIQDVMSSIIYVTDIAWYNKVIEILDILELVIVYIKDSVDSTLVVLNGQLEKYVEELKESENGSIQQFNT